MHRFLTGHVQLRIPSLEVERVTNLLVHDFRCYPTFRHSHLSFERSSWLPPYRTRLRITPCSGDHAPTDPSLDGILFSRPYGFFAPKFIHSITAQLFTPQCSSCEAFQSSGLGSSLARALPPLAGPLAGNPSFHQYHTPRTVAGSET